MGRNPRSGFPYAPGVPGGGLANRQDPRRLGADDLVLVAVDRVALSESGLVAPLFVGGVDGVLRLGVGVEREVDGPVGVVLDEIVAGVGGEGDREGALVVLVV